MTFTKALVLVYEKLDASKIVIPKLMTRTPSGCTMTLSIFDDAYCTNLNKSSLYSALQWLIKTTTNSSVKTRLLVTILGTPLQTDSILIYQTLMNPVYAPKYELQFVSTSSLFWLSPQFIYNSITDTYTRNEGGKRNAFKFVLFICDINDIISMIDFDRTVLRDIYKFVELASITVYASYKVSPSSYNIMYYENRPDAIDSK